MKDYRFYLEYKDKKAKRKGEHSGNVFALYIGAESSPYQPEGAGSVFAYPNSPVAWTGIDYDTLRERFKRIPESEARRIHPELFLYLGTDK